MKGFVCWLFLAMFLLSICAEAAVSIKLYGDRNDGKILSIGCIMSYTDMLGRTIRVLRSNQVVTYLK